MAAAVAPAEKSSAAGGRPEQPGPVRGDRGRGAGERREHGCVTCLGDGTRKTASNRGRASPDQGETQRVLCTSRVNKSETRRNAPVKSRWGSKAGRINRTKHSSNKEEPMPELYRWNPILWPRPNRINRTSRNDRRSRSQEAYFVHAKPEPALCCPSFRLHETLRTLAMGRTGLLLLGAVLPQFVFFCARHSLEPRAWLCLTAPPVRALPFVLFLVNDFPSPLALLLPRLGSPRGLVRRAEGALPAAHELHAPPRAAGFARQPAPVLRLRGPKR